MPAALSRSPCPTTRLKMLAKPRAERHADADLGGALPNHCRHYAAVKPAGRQQRG